MWRGILSGAAAVSLLSALSACDPVTGAQMAGKLVEAVAVESVQDDERSKDCAQDGLLACEEEWAGEEEELAPAITDARTAFAAYLRTDTLEEGWLFLCTAANMGHPAAQLMMARAYKDGWYPVDQDEVKSYTWYRLTIIGGNQFARQELKGLVEEMPQESRTWAEIQFSNWRADPSECEAGFDEAVSGA